MAQNRAYRVMVIGAILQMLVSYWCSLCKATHEEQLLLQVQGHDGAQRGGGDDEGNVGEDGLSRTEQLLLQLPSFTSTFEVSKKRAVDQISDGSPLDPFRCPFPPCHLAASRATLDNIGPHAA